MKRYCCDCLHYEHSPSYYMVPSHDYCHRTKKIYGLGKYINHPREGSAYKSCRPNWRGECPHYSCKEAEYDSE